MPREVLEHPATIPVREAHRFDEAALASYLEGKVEGADAGLTITQFQGGQSNPTFLLSAGDRHRYVLRKKPPGKLLPSAHQVEREYRVMAALAGSAVPVPDMLLLCETDDVIGTPFFIMSYVEGAVVQEPPLEMPKASRAPLIVNAVETLAALHSVDSGKAGLGDFGRPDSYVGRQVARWSRQYEASRTDADFPAMGWLKDWLAEHAGVVADESAIVHGDFRLGNTIVDAARAKILAVLDWELATLGHPLADLAYFCMPYHLPANVSGVRGLEGLDLDELGLPAEETLLRRYCALNGRSEVSGWSYLLVFSLFRMAAILQGVAARAIQGNASSADALMVGGRAGLLAEAGRRIAEKA